MRLSGRRATLAGMEPRLTSGERTAREIESAQRRSGKSWHGNRPGQWAVLGLFGAGVAGLVVVLALIA